mgnify:CR=1 FL=1
MDLYTFIKVIRDRRIPDFGGQDCNGYGRGHGKFFLAQTLRVLTRGEDKKGKVKVVLTNGLY